MRQLVVSFLLFLASGTVVFGQQTIQEVFEMNDQMIIQTVSLMEKVESLGSPQAWTVKSFYYEGDDSQTKVETMVKTVHSLSDAVLMTLKLKCVIVSHVKNANIEAVYIVSENDIRIFVKSSFGKKLISLDLNHYEEGAVITMVVGNMEITMLKDFMLVEEYERISFNTGYFTSEDSYPDKGSISFGKLMLYDSRYPQKILYALQGTEPEDIGVPRGIGNEIPFHEMYRRFFNQVEGCYNILR